MHFINEIPQKTKNGNIKWLIKNRNKLFCCIWNIKKKLF